MVVAGETQHAAVFRRARRIAVAENVTGAINAGTLAVPDADDAIVLRAGRQVELLRAPDCGRREILVHAGLELDAVLREMLFRGGELLVVAAERRAAITGDEACGIQAVGAIAPDLRHRETDQRLDAGHEDMAGFGGVFLVEADRALVYSHLRLFSSPRQS